MALQLLRSRVVGNDQATEVLDEEEPSPGRPPRVARIGQRDSSRRPHGPGPRQCAGIPRRAPPTGPVEVSAQSMIAFLHTWRRRSTFSWPRRSRTLRSTHVRGRAKVTIVRGAGCVTVEVEDDGVGGARLDGGSGLRGLVDRVGALDGRLLVDDRPGAGTRLRAEIPCES